jgi:hypothetical protein
MKLVQAQTHTERQSDNREPQSAIGNPQSAIRNPQWIILASIVVIAFLAGMLIQQASEARTLTVPASHKLAVITSTAPLAAAATVPPPTPLPTFGEAPPTIYINIPTTNWEQITAARERALKRGILLNEDNPEVDGTLRYDDQDMPITVALKGDWTDHLRGDKWSLRIKVGHNYFLFGMAVFAIQNPPVRQYTNEWAYHTNLRRDGVLGLRYRFVNVVLNGQSKGIYALEEGFSKELFEAQTRREGFIMRYNENLLWTWRSLSPDNYVPPGVESFYVIDEYQTTKIINAQGLGAQRQMAEGMLRAVWTGDRRPSEVFDVELMGRFLALTNLWGGQHGLIWHNLRYFYNPLTTRLEPIGFNANAHPDSAKVDLDPQQFYHDPLLQAAYVQSALEVTSPKYLDQLQAELGPQIAAFNQILKDEFGDLPLPWDKLRSRAQQIRQRIQPLQAVYALLPLGESNVVEVGNFLEWPVQVISLEIAGRSIPVERSWVMTDSQSLLVQGTDALALNPLAIDAKDVAYAHISVPRDMISLTASSSISVVTRLLGGTDEQRQQAVRFYPEPISHGPQPTVTVEQALAQHAFLAQAPEDKMLVARSGDWTVNDDLIVPQGYGLRIEPGTTLRLGAGVIIAVYGGPLQFEGEADAPILLTNVEGAETWGGIAVVEAGAPSLLSYVTLQNTGGVSKPGWGTTGALNFYKSPATISHSHFLHIKNTDDTINFVISPFKVLDSYFEDTFADAIDSDFSSSGLVERCVFQNIGNDGVDMSGTHLVLRQSTMTDMGDKGASIGEFSTADIEGITVTRPYMGIAAKDGSRITARNVKIIEPRIAGLASYTKKTEYGPAGLTASNIVFENVEHPTLVQTGNWIDLDGTRIWGIDVDIDKLYLPFTKQR